MTNREKAYFRIITGWTLEEAKGVLGDMMEEQLKKQFQKAKDCAAEEERMIREAFFKGFGSCVSFNKGLDQKNALDDYLKTIKE